MLNYSHVQSHLMSEEPHEVVPILQLNRRRLTPELVVLVLLCSSFPMPGPYQETSILPPHCQLHPSRSAQVPPPLTPPLRMAPFCSVIPQPVTDALCVLPSLCASLCTCHPDECISALQPPQNKKDGKLAKRESMSW